MHSSTLIAIVVAVPLQQAPAKPAGPPPAAAVADAVRFDLLKFVDRVERDGTQVRTQNVQVRLNSAQWVGTFGQLGNYYLEGYGDVQFGEIVIDKSDGRRISVTNAIVEDLNPYGVTTTSLSADLRYKKITIPGLEPGDRLTYRIVTRQKPLAPGRAFGDVEIVPNAGLGTAEPRARPSPRFQDQGEASRGSRCRLGGSVPRRPTDKSGGSCSDPSSRPCGQTDQGGDREPERARRDLHKLRLLERGGTLVVGDL